METVRVLSMSGAAVPKALDSGVKGQQVIIGQTTKEDSKMRALIVSFVALAAGCGQTDVLDRQYVEGKLITRQCASLFVGDADDPSGVECSVTWDGEQGPDFHAVGPVTIAWGRPLYIGHIDHYASPDSPENYETVVWGRREGKHYRRITRGPFFHGERPLYAARLDSGDDEGAEVVVWGTEELNREAFCALKSFAPFEGGLRYAGVPYEPTGGRSACTGETVMRTWFVESHRLMLR